MLKTFFYIRINSIGKPPSSIVNIFSRCLTTNKQTEHIPATSKNPIFPRRGTRSPEQISSRRLWTEEDTKLLQQLLDIHGPKYTEIAKHFPHRSTSTIFNRCKLLFDETYKTGPWTKEELDALRKLSEEAKTNNGDIDWRFIQLKLPYYRSLSHIKHTWYFSINPDLNHGRWTTEETDRLMKLIATYGISDWDKIAERLGTRSSRQCLEKYRHQIGPVTKGRFTPQEDMAIMKAVEKLGDGDFIAIKAEINSTRTPRNLSQRYRYALDPAYDRSPWSEEEERQVYELANKFNSMMKVKEVMNSKRHVKDMWNKYKKLDRIYQREQRQKQREQGNTK
ncbi:uncharacterized protein BX664DRAFT_320263 [Halteromyces radiatus]|uniref:uncharacterized protein n=1 Tax=Halteromyces radiatus TaxID=101107 RepID=UPI00221EBB0F|nr:uncharacterized protein BX664DRAFT_320263 [Halteromyces radiatus]KAI8099050.1 hypothetical protein BX664DRAFT_320263 [Halteromyces radiatus]